MNAAPRGRPRPRRTVLAFAFVALLGVVALAVAGANDQRDTSFSLDLPAIGPVTAVGPNRQVCQGPISAAAPFAGIQIWLGPVPAPGTTLRIRAISAAGATLATGALTTMSPVAFTPSVRLDHTVPSGTQLSICIQNRGRVAVSPLGAPAQPRSGALTVDRRRIGSGASIVLLRPHSESLLSSLPTIFRRAALFRPNWVGAWAFWLLLAGLAVAFSLTAIALALATREESDR